ncbi:hypothetical protein QV08_12345 [Gallibacterium salpingitidis]|uniref:Uncharacterized protein n=1 Tax=Gallibacterium salpingitidis TaxID=505341 RepID=A0AB36E032_9PAST|nr:hypothetical protein [Gallibacterium salpingitidis]OBX04553.1 hypothetical protein QV08_12345 [Gallibacterium salpingitidis]OBX07496.1 hypothetical protein QV09_10875 [Gallibacterium salpingitidis]WKS98590.1 hypothetical protein NYR30_07305 [Gallibacterium salpingitidis]
MNKFVLIRSNIPIIDFGDIAVITLEDDDLHIKQKIIDLRSRVLYQLDLLKEWNNQGALTEQQSQWLYIKPIETAFFVECDLYQMNTHHTSLESLNEDLNKYISSILNAIDSSKDSIIVDDKSIYVWIHQKFNVANS